MNPIRTREYNFSKELIDKIKSLDLSRIQENKSIRFCYLITESQIKFAATDRQFEDGMIQISQKYWTMVDTSKYNVTLDILIKNKIVLTNNLWSKSQEVAQGYMINPIYSNPTEKINIEFWWKESFKRDAISQAMFNHTIRQLSSFKTNPKKMYSIMHTTIDQWINDIKETKNNLPAHISNIGNLKAVIAKDTVTFTIYNKPTTFNKSVSKKLKKKYFKNTVNITALSKLQKFAKTKRLDYFLDDDDIILGDIEQYMIKKRKFLTDSYTASIKSFCAGEYRASINTTNYRLDHNLTNLAAPFIKHIKEENDLVELDLANCQPILMASMFKRMHSSNYELDRFIELAESGKIYDVLVDKNHDRDDVKKAFIISLFGNKRGNTIVTKHWPLISDYIAAFKATGTGKKPHAIFSTTLQTAESTIFIKGIYAKMINNGIPGITKHDSVICKREDQDKIYKLIEEELTIHGINGTIKIS